MTTEEIRLLAFAVLIVAAVTVMMHERHYQGRRERSFDARLRVVEEILFEDRRS